MSEATPPVQEQDAAASGVMRPAQRRTRRPEGTKPVIADHEILRLIGTGAYGEVWLARTVTGAHRAVKVVWREDFEDERSFIREFDGILQYEPIARNNPGLVHILHVGKHDGEFPYYYYVMELADDAYTGIHIEPGSYIPRTLRSDMQLYGLHAMPLDYVLEVGSQLAHALVGLHAEDLIHRDIKPANVVFVNSRAKLADAGLVTHNNRRTFVGTEGYIPPDGPGSPRADVYALAKVLYEMSTGKDRLDFPELPPDLPEGTQQRRWLEFNNIICAAAEPVIGKNSIVTAQVLADKLDAMRGYRAIKPKKQTRNIPTPPPPRKSRRLMLWVLIPALLLALGLHFLPNGFFMRLQRAVQAFAEENNTPTAAAVPVAPATETPTPEQEAPKESNVYILTDPSGASVYSENQEYLGETPYGPVKATPGEQLGYTLRMTGYADGHLSCVAPETGSLKLFKELTPYRPPRKGQVWQDAQGTTYSPKGNTHTADTPVTKAMFEEFARTAEGSAVRYELIPKTDIVRTTPEGIGAYTLWLTGQCVEKGLIGQDHSLSFEVEPRSTAKGLRAYRLHTKLMEKTPITIYTNPAGATVTFNGQVLGVTPMQAVRVPIAPYLLEVRLPGYSTIRRSGLSAKGLVLNLNLEANHSVIFGSEWINSLGQKFIPHTPGLSAAATEVRVADYRVYCEQTGNALPDVNFERNEHHPVVNVSRNDAEAFAQWLTETERKRGIIESTDSYRLPTDEEWSALAGLSHENGTSPYERDSHYTAFTDQKFPWGTRWPPISNSGNFADTAAQIHAQDLIIELYHDGFAHTAPVGSFPADNSHGLHDMCGNVQEWVSDTYGGPEELDLHHHGVTRGGDYTSFNPNQLHLGRRIPRSANEKSPTVGFRLMLERKN